MVFEKVCQILSDQFGVSTDSLNMDTAFVEDLGADSLDLYQILLKVEEEFEMKISPEAVDEIVTVGQAMDLIKKMN